MTALVAGPAGPLSPSRLNDLLTCPRKYYYRAVERRPAALNYSSLKGQLAHIALYRLFDLEPHRRAPEAAAQLVDDAWLHLSDELPQLAEAARSLAPPRSETECRLLAETEVLVRGWFSTEDVTTLNPAAVPLPSGGAIDGRELRVEGTLRGVPVRGTLDRLDYHADRDLYVVTDYKTGRPPPVAPPTRAFTQLKIYAGLVHSQLGVKPKLLRIVYPAAASPAGVFTAPVGRRTLRNTADLLEAAAVDVAARSRSGDWRGRPGRHCAGCPFKQVCDWAL